MADHRVVIYGSSDDLIEVDGEVPGCDEYSSEAAVFVLNGEEGQQVRISAVFGRHGIWALTVCPTDEDIPMLPVSIDADRYTARATVHGVLSVIREVMVDA